MRFWTVFSRWVGPGGAPLGGDLPPSGPPSPPQDNLLLGDRSLTYRDTGQTHRVAVAFSGPSQVTADLYIYEEATNFWYKISSAPVVLPVNTITFFDVAVPLSTAERLQGNLLKPGGELQCVLIPNNPGGLINGEYKFAMAPNLSEPSDIGGGGSSGNVSIISPIPLPVSFSLPTTSWYPPTISSLSNSGVFKNVAGKFYQLVGFSNKSARRFLMLFDSSTVPVNGTPSWMCLNVPADGTFSIDYNRPRSFVSGLSWAISTTSNVLTLDTSAGSFWAQAEVE